MSVADNIQHTARNLTSELPFIVQILGNGNEESFMLAFVNVDNQAVDFAEPRR